jgi:hypothetical protein
MCVRDVVQFARPARDLAHSLAAWVDDFEAPAADGHAMTFSIKYVERYQCVCNRRRMQDLADNHLGSVFSFGTRMA